MPFDVDSKKTYEIIKPGDKHPGLEKRQCTLQVCVRADGKQLRIAVILWGKEKRVCPDEKFA